MRLLKIFGALLVVQCLAWGVSHFYFSTNKSDVLVVVDTSFSMKPNFTKVRQWIDNYESSGRYKSIVIGTDKAEMGLLSELVSKDVIFRTSFGKLNENNLKRLYSHIKADKKILLSDGSLSPSGWDVIPFN